MSATEHDTATDQPVKAARPRLITGKTMAQFKDWAKEQELLASNAQPDESTAANPTPPLSPSPLPSDVTTPSTAAAEPAAQATPIARPALTFLTHRQMTSRPFPTWRVSGLVPETGMGLLYGPSGAGKSFLALDLAAHIAAGLPWFGHKVKASPVVYCSLEGQGGMGVRLKALDGKFPSEALDRILHYEDALLFADGPTMTAIVNEVPSGSVVFIDTLNRAMPGLEENSAKDMSLVLHWCNRLARERGCFVFLIHHTGAVDDPKRPRGSSALFAGADASILVKTHGAKGSRWTADKVKDGEGGQTHEFGIESVHLGHNGDGAPVTAGFIVPVVSSGNAGASHLASPTVELPDGQQDAMDALLCAVFGHSQRGSDGSIVVPVDAWRKEYSSRRQGEKKNTIAAAFIRARKKLTERGLIHDNDDSCTLLPHAPGFDQISWLCGLTRSTAAADDRDNHDKA